MGCAGSRAASVGREGPEDPDPQHAQNPHFSAFLPICEAQPFEQRCYEAVKMVIERNRLKPLSSSTPEDERLDLLRTILANSAETNGRVAHGLRAYAYQILSGGAEIAVNCSGLYRTLLRMGPAEDEIDVVIRRDAGRSMPAMPFFGSRTRPGPGQPQLYRVLTAYCHLDPGCQYTQGSCMLAAMLLLVGLSEEAAFYAFASLMIRGGLRLFYAPGLPLTFKMYEAIQAILQRKKPRLAQALEDSFILPPLYATPWLMSGFVSSPLPVSSCLAVLDSLMIELAPLLSPIPPCFSEAFQAAVVRTAPLSPIAAAEAFLSPFASSSGAASTTKTAIVVISPAGSATGAQAGAGPSTIASNAGAAAENNTNASSSPGDGTATVFEPNEFDELPEPEQLMHSSKRYPGGYSFEIPQSLLRPPKKNYGGPTLPEPSSTSISASTNANGGKKKKKQSQGLKLGASSAANSWWEKLRQACRIKRASLHRTPSPADQPGGLYVEGSDALATSALVRGGAAAAAARKKAGEHLRGLGSGHHFPIAAPGSGENPMAPTTRPRPPPAPVVNIPVCLADVPLSYLQASLYLILVHEPAILKAAFPGEDFESELLLAPAGATSSGRTSSESKVKETKYERKLLAAAVEQVREEQERARQEQQADAPAGSGREARLGSSSSSSSSSQPVSMEPDFLYSRLKDEFDPFPWSQDPRFLANVNSSNSHGNHHHHREHHQNDGAPSDSPLTAESSTGGGGGTAAATAVGALNAAVVPPALLSPSFSPALDSSGSGLPSAATTLSPALPSAIGVALPFSVDSSGLTSHEDGATPAPRETAPSLFSALPSAASIAPSPSASGSGSFLSPSTAALISTTGSGAGGTVMVLGGDYKKPSPSPLAAALSSLAGGIASVGSSATMGSGGGSSSSSGGGGGGGGGGGSAPLHNRRSGSGVTGGGLSTPTGAVATAVGAAGNAVLAAGGAVVSVAGAAGGLITSAASLVASTVLPTPSSPGKHARSGVFSAGLGAAAASKEDEGATSERTPPKRKGSIGGAGPNEAVSGTTTATTTITTPKGGRGFHNRRGSSGGGGSGTLNPSLLGSLGGGGGSGSGSSGGNDKSGAHSHSHGHGHGLAIPIMTANEVALAQRLPSAPILPPSMYTEDATPTFRLRPEQRFADFGAAASTRLLMPPSGGGAAGAVGNNKRAGLVDKVSGLSAGGPSIPLPPASMRATVNSATLSSSLQSGSLQLQHQHHQRRGSFDDGVIIGRRSSLREELADRQLQQSMEKAIGGVHSNPNHSGVAAASGGGKAGGLPRGTGGILFRDSARRTLGVASSSSSSKGHQQQQQQLESIKSDSESAGSGNGGRPLSIGNSSSASTESGADASYEGHRKEEEAIIAATARYLGPAATAMGTGAEGADDASAGNPNAPQYLHSRTRSALAVSHLGGGRPDTAYYRDSSYPTNATAASEWAYQQEMIALGLVERPVTADGAACSAPARPVSASFSSYGSSSSSAASQQQEEGKRAEGDDSTTFASGLPQHQRGSSSSSSSSSSSVVSSSSILRQRSHSDVAAHVASIPVHQSAGALPSALRPPREGSVLESAIEAVSGEGEEGDGDARTSGTRVSRDPHPLTHEEDSHDDPNNNNDDDEAEESAVIAANEEEELEEAKHDHDDPERRYRAVIALAAKSTRSSSVAALTAVAATKEASNAEEAPAASLPSSAATTVISPRPIVPILSAPPLPKHHGRGSARAAGDTSSGATGGGAMMQAEDFASTTDIAAAPAGGDPAPVPASSLSAQVRVPPLQLALGGAASGAPAPASAASTARSIGPAPTERMKESEREGMAGTLAKKAAGSSSSRIGDGTTTTVSSALPPSSGESPAAADAHAHVGGEGGGGGGGGGHRNHHTRHRHHHPQSQRQGLVPGSSSSSLVPLRVGSNASLSGTNSGGLGGGAAAPPVADYPPRGVHAPRRKALFLATEGAKVVWPAEFEEYRTGRRGRALEKTASETMAAARSNSAPPASASDDAAGTAAAPLGGPAAGTPAEEEDDGRDLRAKRRYADYSCDSQPCSVWALPSVLSYSLQHSELLQVKPRDLAWMALFIEATTGKL